MHAMTPSKISAVRRLAWKGLLRFQRFPCETGSISNSGAADDSLRMSVEAGSVVSSVNDSPQARR